VALYAEPYFASWMAERESLALLEPAVDWLSSLPRRYRKRTIRLSTLARARAEPGPLFIKDAILDRIPSTIYASGAHLPGANRTADFPVLLSEPVCWEFEFRFFILNREITTLAPSHAAGSACHVGMTSWVPSLSEIREALQFMEEFLADPDVSLPDAVVVDAGRIAGNGWAVVEANPAWSSALYGCDPVRVLPVLVRACRRR
jgi:hypothetical protein